MRRKDGKPPASVPIKHGLYVRGSNGVRLRDERVRRLARRMRAFCDWLQDSDTPAIRGWAELEILSSTVFAELKHRGIFDKHGNARRLLHDYRMLRLAQLAYERELGLTPAARLAIKVNGTNAALDLIGTMATDAIESSAASANGVNGADGKDG